MDRILRQTCVTDYNDRDITNRWTGATGSDFRIKRDPTKHSLAPWPGQLRRSTANLMTHSVLLLRYFSYSLLQLPHNLVFILTKVSNTRLEYLTASCRYCARKSNHTVHTTPSYRRPTFESCSRHRESA